MQKASLAGGAATWFNCPGARGGPVILTSAGNPMLAFPRVAYDNAFSEIDSGAEPCQLRLSLSACPGAAGL